MKKLFLAGAAMLALASGAQAEVTAADIPPEIKAEIKERCTKEHAARNDKYAAIALCIEWETKAWAKVENFK
ncbi:hypothetical protein [Sinorhizobium meliloti]|uniref:hypothetical protein n=1 Tax=Rhizobium meliloti TaxID=382 RepID=UPI000FD9F2CF|nr:hypothetical protein [Sinorhizobium meliloti]MDX1247538.1 hypothetical protein [Sinorhizobium medicae]MQV80704.1 hypothetical protein [Sinorhizobium meliloti]RVL26614.1 hypothetical protein CN144_23215 [Sinorhizobium meliloti]